MRASEMCKQRVQPKPGDWRRLSLQVSLSCVLVLIPAQSQAQPTDTAESPACIEVAFTGGAALRRSRGIADRLDLDGYRTGVPWLVGLDTRLVLSGSHGPVARLHALSDIAVDDAIQGERFNLHVVDVGYAYRVPLYRRAGIATSISMSGGLSAAQADAKWDDGLRFLLPCLGTGGAIESCQARRNALRATDTTFDHTALGGFLTVGFDVRRGGLLLGGALDQRLLRSTDDDPRFLHHVVSVRVTLGLATDL